MFVFALLDVVRVRAALADELRSQVEADVHLLQRGQRNRCMFVYA